MTDDRRDPTLKADIIALALSRSPDPVAAAGACFAAFRQIVCDTFSPEAAGVILREMLAPEGHTFN